MQRLRKHFVIIAVAALLAGQALAGMMVSPSVLAAFIYSLGRIFTPVQIYNVTDYGALGNTVPCNDGTVVGQQLTSASACSTWSAASVGEPIILHGVGVAGAPVQTTIASFVSAHVVTVTATLTSGGTGLSYASGHDDTAGVEAAIAAAVAADGEVNFPCSAKGPGIYWLATQNSAISLNDVHLKGCGIATSAGNQYTFSQLWLSNASTVAFTLRTNIDWDGLSIFYPAQDGYASTPTVFPATFECSVPCSNDTFNNFAFINPYILLLVDDTAATSGCGRLMFDHGRGYAVKYGFQFTEGCADMVEIGKDTFWSVGADADANLGSQFLPTWTASNGDFVHVDIGAATDTIIAALSLHAHIVHGYLNVVNVLSGQLDAVDDIDYDDGDETALNVQGTATYIGTFQAEGWVYSNNPYGSGADNATAISLTCNGGSQLQIINTQFQHANGSFIVDNSAGCASALAMRNNFFHAWGQSTTTGTYYAVDEAGTATKMFSSQGDTMFGVAVAGTSQIGLAFSKTNGINNISGLSCKAVSYCIWDAAGDSGTVYVNDSMSENTVTASLRQTSTNFIIEGVNFWDKPPKPAITSCGTSPSNTGTDMGGTITLGSGGTTTCTVTFSLQKSAAPIVSLQLQSPSTAAYAYLSALSATAFTATFSSSLTSGTLLYQLRSNGS